MSELYSMLKAKKTGASSGGGGGATVNNATITIQKNGTTVDSFTSNQATDKTINITVPTSAADVSALPDTTKYAAALSLTINSSTFVMTGQLKDQNGDNLGTAQTIDLPLESVVVNGSYNSQTKKVVLTLQNGNTIEFSVADLVSGLQTELSASNKLNPAYINYDSTHAAVSDTEKSTWNGKQNAIDSSHKLSADLVDDTSTTNKFATAAELEQIETNKNNISLLETKVNTNVSIISQTYNSTDCNISLILIQDSTEDLYVHYDTEARKLYMPYKVIKNQYKYWKDGVAYYKYHVLTEGVIMTNNSAKCNMLTSDTPEIANETYKRSWVATDDGGSAVTTAFNLSKANSEIGDVWYNRPYIIYDDLETGMRYKMYGPVYKITAGTPCTIECDTLSCTELTAAIRAIQALLANQ